MSAFELAQSAAAASAGLGLGFVYFALLRRTVAQLAVGGGWRTALLLSLVRIGVAALVFVFLARLGAIPLICAGAGFLVARGFALARLRER